MDNVAQKVCVVYIAWWLVLWPTRGNGTARFGCLFDPQDRQCAEYPARRPASSIRRISSIVMSRIEPGRARLTVQLAIPALPATNATV